MSISPWRPWRDLTNLREEMFRAFLPGFWDAPRLDIYQTEDEIVATADLPGLASKDDVEITATNDSLTIRGEIRRDNEVGEQNYYRAERFYGNFARTISLPAQVIPEKATATYRNGILEIRLPKAAGQREKNIKIDIH
ncbi:MAG: hypothetical protein PWP65_1557 [Clostridia bacterium]|nr:hypothetical protein [Clostridia bacterium]